MSKPPLLDKNAYLAIYISQDTITANLAYSHYEIGRHYILNDDTYFDEKRDSIEDQKFWDEYFQALSDKFDWEIVESTETEMSLAQIYPFRDEGSGVAGISFTVHPGLENRTKVLAIIHSYLPTAEIHTMSEKALENYLPQLADKLNYEDIIYLSADFEKFDLIRYRKLTSKEQKNKKELPFISTKIYWDSKRHLMESIKDKRFKAFTSIDIDDNSVSNQWANFVSRPLEKSSSYVLHDLLRSFLTVQLVSMLNNKPDAIRGFGTRSKRSLLVMNGRLSKFLDPKEIVISLLDGFQLRGQFDLYNDTDARFPTFAEKFASGINARDFIVPNFTILESVDKVLSLEVAGKKDQKNAAFAGDTIIKGIEEQIFVVAPSLMQFDLPTDPGKSAVLSGKFVKEAYVEGLDKELIITSSEESGYVNKVFFDARYKPVVYGPDFRSNRNKLKVWVSE